MSFYYRFSMRPLVTLAYLLLILVGVMAAIVPAPSYQATGGSVLTYVWAGFLIVGGILGVAEVFVGTLWTEIFGLCLLITAVLSYAVALISRSFVDMWRPPYAGITILVCSLLLAHRLVEIYRFLQSTRRL